MLSESVEWKKLFIDRFFGGLVETNQLEKLANYKMPFGKYAGWVLVDLPEPYVCWFVRKGLPSGELGELMGLLYEVKSNGLEYLIEPLKVRTF